ncbi:hypothetical protein PQX77_012846 [Marasmius sp. AFHP31]|nr:hypothetical protein PQX77_012846 [Marasmius sp. AFHP31]
MAVKCRLLLRVFMQTDLPVPRLEIDGREILMSDADHALCSGRNLNRAMIAGINIERPATISFSPMLGFGTSSFNST